MPNYRRNQRIVDNGFPYRGYIIDESGDNATVKKDGVSMSEEDTFEDAKDWVDETIEEESTV